MKKFNTAYLPYVGAFAQAVLFTFAGVHAYGVWGWLIGPGVGITASLSVAVASSGIGSITSKGRKQLATAGLILMGIFSASTIALSLGIPGSIWTAISWGCAVDVSIVLAGAISGRGLVASDTIPSGNKPAEATAKTRSAKPKRSLSEITCRYAGAGCGRKFVSQNAANAHARACGFKPTIAMPVDVSNRNGKP